MILANDDSQKEAKAEKIKNHIYKKNDSSDEKLNQKSRNTTPFIQQNKNNKSNNLIKSSEFNSKEKDFEDESEDEEAHKYFLNSKEKRKLNKQITGFEDYEKLNRSRNNKNPNFYNDNKSNEKDFDLYSTAKVLEPNTAIKEISLCSENSIFYKNNYFKDELFNPKKLKKSEFLANKDELLIREKLMYYYLNPKNYTAMPKFMKISTREKKCHEIMQYQEAQVPERLRQFYDPYLCLKLRKTFFKFFETIKKYLRIIKHPIFDNISLLIILVNTLFILISDPTDQNSLANTTDQYFLYLFSIEMFLKFLAFGLIIPPNSYFRDYWNILDFMVVVVGWISYVIENSFGGQKISGLAGLRAFRILRPLKTIKSIKGLRRIIGTLLESMLALGDIVIVLFFFFLIFAIAGLQMWSGLFLRRCHSSLYGYRLSLDDYQNMCTSNDDCAKFNRDGERFFCAVTDQNPNVNVTHYDNLVNGLITVFIIATMEGWTDLYNYISNTFQDDFKINTVIIFFYFHVLLFVGGYYLINLYLAVINTKYAEIEKRNRKIFKKENLSLYSILMETFNNTAQEAENGGNKDNNNNLNANNANNPTKQEQQEEEMANLNEEEKIKKIKDEVNLFEEDPSNFPVSYEILNDIFTLRTFTAKELYEMRGKVLKEANKALEEFKQIFKERKKSEKRLKQSNKNKYLGKKLLRSTTTIIKDELKNFKNQAMLRKRKNTKQENQYFQYTDDQILDEIVPLSIQKTLEKFEDDIEKGNLEVEKKNKTKRINQERKNQKIQQILNKKIDVFDKEKGTKDSSESDSNSSDNDKSNKQKEIEKSKNDEKEKEKEKENKNANSNTSNQIEKKATGLTDKKTTDADEKKNAEAHDLSFSINTSDDSSYSFGYINESVDKEKEIKSFDNEENNAIISNNNYVNNNDLERKINDQFKNKLKEKYAKKDFNEIINNGNASAAQNNFNHNNNNKIQNEYINEEDDEHKNIILKTNRSRNKENKIINSKNPDTKNILIKKTLVDEENDLYNKMIVAKPENPMITLPKYKEEKIMKKKKNLWRTIAKTSEILEENFHAVFKQKQRKDISFLDFLKNTEEAGQKYKQITVDEIRNYENELEDQSLDISVAVNDPALIIEEKSEIENLSGLAADEAENSLDAENKKIEELIFLNEKLEQNQFQYNMKNSITDKKKAKRNSLNTLEGNKINLLKKIKKLDLLSEFNGTSIDSLTKLNNIVSSNSSRNKENHNSIPVNNQMFISSNKIGQMNNNFGIMNFIENSANKKLNNLNLFKYDNDMIMRLDLKLATTKKLGKKRAFSIKRNEIKFAFIETNAENNNFERSNTAGASKIHSANSLINLNDKEKANLKKSLLKNSNPFDLLRRKEKDHLQNYRKYMKYLNFIINKDFAVIDNFPVDDFYSDVMGKKESAHYQANKNFELDPIKIFNQKTLNLKTNRYIKYKIMPIIEDDLFGIKNNLKMLPLNVLCEMDSKTKDFRLLYTKERQNLPSSLSRTITVDGNPNAKISSKKNVDRFSKTKLVTTGTSTLHKSTSMISNSSFGLVKKKVLKEIQMNVEKNMARAYDDYLALANKLKIKQFFEKDKYQRLAESDKNNNIAKIKIDVDLNKEDIKNKIEKIRNYDTETNTHKYKEWSAHQVMYWDEDCKKYEKWNSLISEIEQVNIILWSNNDCMKLIINRIRYVFFKLSTNVYFESFILFIVIFNIVTMLLAGNLFSLESQDVIKFLNLGFNCIFIFEFVCKFIGLGPIIYFSDAFTYLDTLIIALAILDLTNLNVDDIQTITSSTQKEKKLSSQFAFFKVFRIFRVLRIAKILRRIKSFRKILVGIKNSLDNVAYNSLILLIFLIIFQLLGMSFLSQDENYQSFFASFYITFQLLTIENWNSVLFKLSQFNRLSVLYLVALIFIGNYILFNLFISILLNSFDSTSMADISNEESEELHRLPEEFAKHERMELELKNMSKRRKSQSKAKISAIGASENSDDSDDEKSFSQSVSGNENMIKTSFTHIQGVKKFMKNRSAVNSIFSSNECEYSLFLFSQTSKIRLYCKNIASLKKFDTFILYMILLSTFRLIIDTFLNGSTSAIVFDMVDIFFTMVFLFEMVFKIIALGFVLDEGSYLKDNWNRIDFIIVMVSLIDLQNLISKYTGSVSSSSLNFLKVLRLLRTLRPLRFISHNVQLKIIITALLDSIGPIANVLIIVFIILLVFSIVGMTLFYELYHTCYVPSTITPFMPILNFTDSINFANKEDYNKIEKLQELVNK